MTLDWFKNYVYAHYLVKLYTDIFLYQNMHNNKNKHSGGVSCSACNAFFYNVIGWNNLHFDKFYCMVVR